MVGKEIDKNGMENKIDQSTVINIHHKLIEIIFLIFPNKVKGKERKEEKVHREQFLCTFTDHPQSSQFFFATDCEQEEKKRKSEKFLKKEREIERNV